MKQSSSFFFGVSVRCFIWFKPKGLNNGGDCFGAALAARVGTGVYRDFSEAQRDLRHPVRTLQPDMAAHQVNAPGFVTSKDDDFMSSEVDELRPKTRAPSEKQTGKPSKKVLAKRAEKKKAKEKEKPRVKKRHRDTKNIGKRRKPSGTGVPPQTTEE